MTALISSVDVRLSPDTIAGLYPRSAPRIEQPRPLSSYMVDRLPEPVRSFVVEALRGRQSQVEAVLLPAAPGRLEVLVRNRRPVEAA